MGKKTELLTALDCKTRGDGKHPDGLGLSLIVRGESRAWTLRYTAPDGRQREIGLGALADVGLKAARDAAADMRDKVRSGVDPLAERAAQREAAEAERIRKQSEHVAERATLLRVVRDYHEAHVEPKRSTSTRRNGSRRSRRTSRRRFSQSPSPTLRRPNCSTP